MQETRQDLADLEQLLDESRRSAGPHLREVFADDRALTAEELADRLTGVRILAVATTSAAGDPMVAPLDGIFYRGRFHFASTRDSVRTRHLVARPAVSATYFEGESLAVVVHGKALKVDLDDPDERGFRACLVELYAPRYGPKWIDYAASSACYFRIEPRRLFASRLPEP
jgi:Pyridoxamine 5'-phosphate oxidase